MRVVDIVITDGPYGPCYVFDGQDTSCFVLWSPRLGRHIIAHPSGGMHSYLTQGRLLEGEYGYTARQRAVFAAIDRRKAEEAARLGRRRPEPLVVAPEGELEDARP